MPEKLPRYKINYNVDKKAKITVWIIP